MKKNINPSFEHPATDRPAKQSGRRQWLRSLAAVMATLALFLISIGSLTFIQANELMRRTPVGTEPYASNTMPDYRLARFNSLDESIQLEGWYFPASREARGTVILIHSNGSNRLPFGTRTNYLIRRILDNRFNVFTFDQRHSGTSGGSLNTFGYGEGEDVLAAIQYVKKASGSANCILFGIGSGNTAAIRAWQLLPETAGAQETGDEAGAVRKTVAALPFDRNNIKGLIFDTPLSDSDAYIRYEVRESTFFAKALTQHTIPFAVRMSADLAQNISLTTVISRLPVPVLIISPAKNDHLSDETFYTVARERLRIADKTSVFYESPTQTYLGAYETDQTAYLSHLQDFLKTQIR